MYQTTISTWWKTLILSSLGGAFELYDFVIFAAFAIYIGQSFFPPGHASLQLIQAFALFAVGYLSRPLGGIILGHIGDKYGRKKVFVFSISLMGASTVMMGLLPTYTQIGIIAPVLLLIIRLIQGFALGGELPGSITFVFEHTLRFQGFATGFLFSFINIGLILGQLVHAVLMNTLSLSQVANYGWRIAFLFGGILAIASYFMQRKLTETPAFKKIHKKEALPFINLLKHHPVNTIAGMLIVSLGAVLISMLFLFMPNYLLSLHFTSPKKVVYLILTGLIFFSLFIPVAGFLSDFIGRKRILAIVSLAFIILAFPLYHFFITHKVIYAITLYLALSLIAGGVQGTFPSLLSEMFGTHIRYTAIATCYNITFAILGGLSPLVASIIMKSHPNTINIAWVLTIAACATLLGVFLASASPPKQAARFHGKI